ncbi:citrate synthase (plasmid) [Cupriavidus necator N-1]|uniref:citrate synthase (unknown stereospecificity) n=1 Tax=Cupriavidus necator (strain ATCC 43291 / DSM 13513 / CCUG 52238 / LMG 8453 / N-1) TaxID=1042878 RepID=F8GV29_CUPNN|nr:citryl-CoA lyase [Cupriavidus necator]AEI81456.1 citrate synthase [Cupriavidus necator N-1]MDX6007833.1 citryl-CoA lyase [Cupriavidus necator]
MIKTEIGFTTIDKITVRGLDLSNDIIGKFDFIDMIFHTTLVRLPEAREKAMVNAILVTTADHGITPSALAARLTYAGAPEALQGAVAAGLLGAGNVFLGTMQNAAEMLREGAQELADDASGEAVHDVARNLIRRYREARRPIFGLGHPIHIHGDPRVPALRELSRRHGYYGKHWRLMDAIGEVFGEEKGKSLPLNAVAAIGAMIAELALDPLMARGLAIVGRSAGLLAHVVEEKQAPIASKAWLHVLSADSRNELP